MSDTSSSDGTGHLQRDGQRVIALMGGGTAMIGDPSGKTEMRKMLTEKQLEDNVGKIKPQMERFLDFSGDSELINNSEWLRNLNYIDFLRDIGRHFSVNRMLSFETYKVRLKQGFPSWNSITSFCRPMISGTQQTLPMHPADGR